ncbi:MAG: hypothetical protein JWP69_1577 [Flaviaesturariibacter sp.]|nr:hypothetical protein [Flaviaesturariibacter sp.]
MKKQLWHYTAQVRLDEIIKSKELKVSEFERKSGDKHPCVWFSTNPFWDPSATKMVGDKLGNVIRLTMPQHLELLGFGRIEVDPSIVVLNWEQYKKISGLKKSEHRHMEKLADGDGSNPKHWFASTQNIDSSNWLAVEYFNGKEWVRYLPDKVD